MPAPKKIGAGMTVEEFNAKVAEGIIKHHGLPESVAMVADGLGLPVDDITETIEPVVAKAPVKTEFLEVAAGQAAGVHQIARGFVKGKEKIYLELQMTTTAAVATSPWVPPGMVSLISGVPESSTVSEDSGAPTYICNSR